MATETRHSQYRQFLRVPRNESKTPSYEIYRMRSTEKITNRRLQSITDWQSSAITITLSLNASIHQQEPCTKLETIFESTRLPYTMKHTDEAHSRLHSTESSQLHRHPWHIRIRSSLPGMSAYKSDETKPTYGDEKTHPARRMKPTYRTEQLHNRSTPMEEMLCKNERNAP